MGSLDTIGGGAAGGSTAPGLTVTDRSNGAAYTVTAGSRSLSISNPDGATLSTTVKRASDGSSILVTNSTQTNPSWTAPSGGVDGAALQVTVTATAGGLSTVVAFTEKIISTGLADIALEEIDLTDGTWTLEDPDSLVDSTAFASGINTVTWNAATASSDLVMTTGTNFRGPRWYKLIKASAQQLTTASPMVLVVDIEPDKSVGSDFNQKHYIGTSHQPTSTVTNTINGVGASFQLNSGATNLQMGVWARKTTSLSPANAQTERSFVVSQRGFESLGSPGFINLRSNDVANFTNARQSNLNAIGGAGANLYIVVALGTSTQSSAIAAGDQTRFTASFIASSYTGI
tara:strand:- start:437 stop:1471 length:1035 start_codon:yes stop_codon:yes gene_type:complete